MKNMTKGNITANIINFSIPLILGNFLQQLYNVTDTIIVGRLISKEALASVGASFPIIFLIIAIIFGLTLGATVLESQFYGARDIENLKKVNGTLYFFLFTFSIIVTLLGVIFSKEILVLIGTPYEVLKDANSYLRINFLGSIFIIGFHGLSSSLRGVGDSKTPLYLLLISTVSNIILDILFILYFNWGIEGAAWATVISEGISLFLGISILHKKDSILKLNLKYFKIDVKLLKTILKIGIPTGIQQTLVALGFIGLTKIVNNFGKDALTGFTVAGRLDSFAMMPAMSFSAALSTFTGQNIGAKKIDRAREGLKKTILISSIYSLIVAITIYFFGTDIIKLFTDDNIVIQISHEYLVIVTSFYIAFSLMFAFHGFLRGIGDTFVPMFFTIISLWGLRIPMAYILSKKIGLIGIWWAIPIAWVVGAFLSFLYYSFADWQKKISISKIKPKDIEIIAEIESESIE